MQFEKMITEGSNTASAEIDRVSTLEMCRIINDEDKTVPLAVERVLPDIAAAIDVIHAQVSGGGRLIYLGAGTSGRLGILDASECPPTYGVKPGLVVGLIAGGEYAIQHAVEGAEDSREGGVNDLKNINLTDVCSGRRFLRHPVPVLLPAARSSLLRHDALYQAQKRPAPGRWSK